MRKLFLAMILTVGYTTLYCQDSLHRRLPFSDTTLTEVNLPRFICDKKIIKVKITGDLCVYLSESNVRKKATQNLSRDFSRAENKEILSALDKTNSDTIVLSIFMRYLEYI